MVLLPPENEPTLKLSLKYNGGVEILHNIQILIPTTQIADWNFVDSLLLYQYIYMASYTLRKNMEKCKGNNQQHDKIYFIRKVLYADCVRTNELARCCADVIQGLTK